MHQVNAPKGLHRTAIRHSSLTAATLALSSVFHPTSLNGPLPARYPASSSIVLAYDLPRFEQGYANAGECVAPCREEEEAQSSQRRQSHVRETP